MGKTTPKQRVLKKSPGAWLWFRPESDDYIVMPKDGYTVFQALGSGDTARQAWVDAWKYVRVGGRSAP